jgi:hypothetical protein
VTGKFDDSLKIDYSLVKPKEDDYEEWKVYFKDLCLYIKTKFINCYGSKEDG